MAIKKNNKVAKVITLIAFFLVLYIEFLWLIVALTKGLSNQSDKVNAFLHHFPSFINSVSEITYITLICAAIAIISSVKWKNESVGSEKNVRHDHHACFHLNCVTDLVSVDVIGYSGRLDHVVP